MFIAIEWADGTGKATQTALLAKKAHAAGYRVATTSFPSYESWSSEFVRRFLGGEFGAMNEVDPYLASTFYTLDRYAHRDGLIDSILGNDLVLSDRYTISSMLHRGAEFYTRRDTAGMYRFFAWLDEWEYERARLPRSDMTIFLSVSIETLSRLLAARHRDTLPDIAERDMRHQNSALAIGRAILPDIVRHYHVIECEDEEGEILPPEVICERIWDRILPWLSQSRA